MQVAQFVPTKNTFSLYNNATKAYLGELNVTYSVIGQSTPVVPVKFDINVNMLQQPPGTPLKQMSENALYHLREQHPVIDAVGVFLCSDATKWLLLIQISLCKYSSHSSKAGDLKKQVVSAKKKTQLTSPLIGCSTITTWSLKPKGVCMYTFPQMKLGTQSKASALIWMSSTAFLTSAFTYTSASAMPLR